MKIMRLTTLTGLLLCAFGFKAQAQTAATYLAQGRAYLAASNLVSANLSFSNALVLSPNDSTGNVFYAATRLLVLPSQPVGSNFLSRWGMPVPGRNIYHWTARAPKDSHGVLTAPSGVDANEATSLLRTNILAVLIAAEANLAMVTNTNFTLTLTSQETGGAGVTLDYGDIQVLRAMAQGVEYFIYNTGSWNLDAQLTVVRSFYTNQQFSFDGLLRNYPSLLNFASTNDLNNAKTAFTNGANRYLTASQFIRQRPAGLVRLFNLDPHNANEEANFRLTLVDLQNSLNGIVPSSINPTFSLYLPAQFTGAHPPRSFLPQFHNQGFIAGTLPDPTFGGTIYGFTADAIEPLLAHHLTPIPNIAGRLQKAANTFQFPVYGVSGHGYVIQVSSNLIAWSDYAAFFSQNNPYQFVDLLSGTGAPRFYRVQDRTHNMPPPANDNFTNAIPLSGLDITISGYNANATTEVGEPGFAPASVWWSWTSPFTGPVVLDTSGSSTYPYLNVYTGSFLGSLSQASYFTPPPNTYYNGFSFYAIEGTTYQIQAGSFQPGAIKFALGIPPDVIVESPLNGSVYPVATNIPVSAFAVDLDGPLNVLKILGDGQLLASGTNQMLSMVWTNVGPGIHRIEAAATDIVGITTHSYVDVIVRPSNDNFANRIAIPNPPTAVYGANQGASSETGEPYHAGIQGGNSVWWSWTAPSNGVVTMTADLVAYGSEYPLLGVYTGTNVSALTPVAASASIYGGPAQVSFNASAGVTYQIAVDGQYGATGNITLRVIRVQPPVVTISLPTDGKIFTNDTSTNITLTASASVSNGVIGEVDFYAAAYPYPLIGTALNPPYSVVWSNLSVGSYSFVAKARDNNSGVFGYSPGTGFSVVATPQPETPLTLGTPVNNLSGAPGSMSYFNITIPPGKSSLTISISGSSYCGLYVQHDSQPTLSTYDYASSYVQISNPTAGTWHIMLYGNYYYGGVTLLAQ